MRIALLLGCLLVVLILFDVPWFSPTIHGKSEGYWINSLEKGVTVPNDMILWRSFGSDAVPILLKALQKRPGPSDRIYIWLLPKLPTTLRNKLPMPRDCAKIRASAAAMLTILDPKITIPSKPLALAISDESWMVRMNAIGCLSTVVLPALEEEPKQEILPSLLDASKDLNSEVRMVAVYSLCFFTNQAQAVVPVLTNALHDTEPDVRVRASMALYKVDPASRSSAIHTAYECVKNKRGSPHGAEELARKFLEEIGESLPNN